MPTYDYVCDKCEHSFELFQQMSEPVKRKCPKCGARKLRRLIGTGAGVLFKGSGFYETDYRSDSYKKAADKDKPADKSDAKKSDAATTKTDAKNGGSTSSDSKPKSDTKGATKKKSGNDT